MKKKSSKLKAASSSTTSIVIDDKLMHKLCWPTDESGWGSIPPHRFSRIGLGQYAYLRKIRVPPKTRFVALVTMLTGGMSLGDALNHTGNTWFGKTDTGSVQRAIKKLPVALQIVAGSGVQAHNPTMNSTQLAVTASKNGKHTARRESVEQRKVRTTLPSLEGFVESFERTSGVPTPTQLYQEGVKWLTAVLHFHK